jgi:Intracellular septation protein A
MLGKEMTLPEKVWRQLTWFWGIGFSGIALVNAYYVDIALSTRDKLFNSTELDPKVELTELDCASTTVEQLCLAAQQSEESWVNFKLFGTMGLTFALIIITVIFISKYIKEGKK